MFTKGEIRMHIDFNNPPKDEPLARVVAEMINNLDELKQQSNSHPHFAEDIARWCDLAQTAFEQGADYAAKAKKMLSGGSYTNEGFIREIGKDHKIG